MLACLIGYFGDFDLAEEATAEAFAVAAQRWPGTGMPDNPGAWLVTTARHRAIDRLRRDRVLAAKLPLLAQQPDHGGGRHDRPAHPGRAARARLHVLPPGAGHRGAGGADAARGGRADHRGDRPGLPGPGRDDEAPADPRQVQDQGGRHPVRRPGRVAAAGAARRGARRRLSHLQRGLQRAGPRIKPGRRGDQARPGAGRAPPGRAGGARAAGADAAARRAPRGPVRRPGPGAAAGSGPVAVGLAADRRGQGPAGPRPARPGPAARTDRARPVRPAGRHRLPAGRRPRSTGRRSPRSTPSSPTGPVRTWSG